MHGTSHPAAEPPNGDFVAYLAQIEKRQLQTLRSAAPVTAAAVDNARAGVDREPPALNHDQAMAVLDALKLQAADGVKANPRLLQAVIPAVIGVVFLLSGLVGDTGIFGIGVGIFLFWIASRQWREAMGEGAGKPVSRLTVTQRDR